MKQRGFTSTSMSYPYNLLESHLWITNRHECRAAKLHAIPWMRTAGIRTTQPNQTRTNACYVQLSVTVCRPILEIWLIEWFILLCWADDDNDVEVLELPLQCTHPAKAFQVWHHHHHHRHHECSHRCITTNITRGRDKSVTCWRPQLPFQEASPSRRWKQPIAPHGWRWSPETQPTHPIRAMRIHGYIHIQHGETSGISRSERVPEKAPWNWGGTDWLRGTQRRNWRGPGAACLSTRRSWCTLLGLHSSRPGAEEDPA